MTHPWRFPQNGVWIAGRVVRNVPSLDHQKSLEWSILFCRKTTWTLRLYPVNTEFAWIHFDYTFWYPDNLVFQRWSIIHNAKMLAQIGKDSDRSNSVEKLAVSSYRISLLLCILVTTTSRSWNAWRLVCSEYAVVFVARFPWMKWRSLTASCHHLLLSSLSCRPSGFRPIGMRRTLKFSLCFSVRQNEDIAPKCCLDAVCFVAHWLPWLHRWLRRVLKENFSADNMADLFGVLDVDGSVALRETRVAFLHWHGLPWNVLNMSWIICCDAWPCDPVVMCGGHGSPVCQVASWIWRSLLVSFNFGWWM